MFVGKATEHLPRVDAIGGSSAGVIVNNKPRVASLFRGIPEDLFDERIKPLFLQIGEEWGAPLEVINDGDVTFIGVVKKQTAETTGEVDIEFFDQAAKDLFNDGLKQLKFTVVIAIPEGTNLELADGEEADTKKKPQGDAEISVVAKITYSVTPSELVGDAKDAYDNGELGI